MNLRSIIRQQAEFDKMKYIYKLIPQSNIKKFYRYMRNIIIICTVTEIVMFFAFETNFRNFIAAMVLCLSALIFVETSKENIRQSSSYVYFVFFSVVVLFEYVLVSGFCGDENMLGIKYIFITIFMWFVAHFFRIPYIRSILAANGKSVQKKAERFGVLTSQLSLVFLTPAIAVMRRQRHTDFTDANWELVFLFIHLALSMVHVWMINRILFAIIYREEIAAELEMQREAIEEKKANRRKLKRKE